MDLPGDRKYLKSHEWVLEDGDTFIVGITDFAQDQLGDVVFVELPTTGDSVTEGEGVAVVESVKTASDIYAPFDGEIVEANDELDSAPDLLNTDPYGEGWLFRIRPAGPVSDHNLLTAEEYKQQVEDED